MATAQALAFREARRRWRQAGEIGPPPGISQEKPSTPKPIKKPKALPGTKLKEIIGSRYRISPCEACLETMRKMDANGVQWCRDNKQELAKELEANAKSRVWTALLAAAAKATGLLHYEQLIEEACDACEPELKLPPVTPKDVQRVAVVGVTTAHRENPTLDKTLASLDAAGWPDVMIFDDGGSSGIATATVRNPPAGAFSNWWLSLQAMVMANPLADYYLISQDDAIYSTGAREYVEGLPLLDRECVLSLFCSARYKYQETVEYRDGFAFAGAVSLLFTRPAAEKIVASGLGVSHRRRPRRSNDAIDQAVGGWCKENGVPLYVQAPSLVQHIGDTSTLGHIEKPSRVFVESTKSAVKRTVNIGLLGWNTASGLGTLNRAIAKHLPDLFWLIPRHPDFETLPDVPGVYSIHSPRPVNDIVYEEFLTGVDVLMFCEQPAVARRPDVLTFAKRLGVATVCVPMIEWLDDAGQSGIGDWPALVDLFLCPTQQCFDAMGPLRSRSVLLPWPIDLSEITYQQRKTCERFVFIHGTGGRDDRKGGQIMAAAARLTPDIPLIVYSQFADGIKSHRASEPIGWPEHVDVRGQQPTIADLYRDGDVCIQPSRNEGLGLQLIECQAAGLPLVTTDGPPMTEYEPLRAIQATSRRVRVHREITCYDADPRHLAEIMRELYGSDVSQASEAARLFALGRDWRTSRPAIEQAIRGVL